jgi:hypothetical protein
VTAPDGADGSSEADERIGDLDTDPPADMGAWATAEATAATAATLDAAWGSAATAADAADAAASAADAADAAASDAEAATTVRSAARASELAQAAAEAAAEAADDAAAAADAAAALAMAAAEASEAAAAAAEAADADAAAAADDAEYAAAAARDAGAAVDVRETSAQSVPSRVVARRRPGVTRTRRRKNAAAASVVALVALLLAGLAFAVARPGHGARADAPPGVPDRPTPTVAGTQSSRPEPGSRGSRSAAHRLAACRHVVGVQDAALRSAQATIDDWQVHVGAMNKFAAGVVTLEQLNAFWDRTGQRAAARLRDFRRHAEGNPSRAVGCPRPPQAGAATLRACAEAVRHRRAALRIARAAAETWASQMDAMRQLRSDGRSAAQARDTWLQARQTYVSELRDFRRAVRGVSQAASCA